MLEIDRKIFDRNLLLTQAYCDIQLANSKKSTAEVLRSFNPEYNGRPVFSFKTGCYAEVSWAEDPWNDNLYDKLFEDQLLNKEQQIKTIDDKHRFQGRILVAEIDTSVTDGASEAESEGFIDIYDCPPIDTWFYKTQNNIGRVFYAWIPEQFVEITQNAIDVNAVECFTWKDDFVLRQEPDVPYYYTYQTKFPPAEKHKNTLFWILGFVLLIRLMAYLAEKITK